MNSPRFRAASKTSSTQLVSVEDAPIHVDDPTLFAGLGHLKTYAAAPEGQVHRPFYEARITKLSGLLAVLNGQATNDAKQAFFSKSTALWDNVKVFMVETLPAAIAEGPFIGGARPGVDDFHVGVWVARFAWVSGARKSEEGVSMLEKRFGSLPEKVKAYWAAWIARDSWVMAYLKNALV
jgi:hypothetical protein